MTNSILPKKVLLAEDNLADYELTRLAFEALDFSIEIIHINDGQKVLDFFQENSIDDISLMLLDLNMPKVNGIEILKMMYEDTYLRKLPVIVLSSSLQESDVHTCYEYGANAYVNKPIDFQEFNTLISSIAHFWLGVNLGPVFQVKN